MMNQKPFNIFCWCMDDIDICLNKNVKYIILANNFILGVQVQQENHRLYNYKLKDLKKSVWF